MANSNFRIQTPHAAIIIWNYDDRVSADPAASPASINKTDKRIISTLSCTEIRTSKSKSNPQGSFQIALAPTKNWISAITVGSWCAILMSDEPITQKDFDQADHNKVKMIGKIESVRCDTQAGPDGARTTRYLVAGVDWGYIFNNVIYIDNYLSLQSEPRTLGNATAVAIDKILFGERGLPKSFSTHDNLSSLINIFGKTIAFQKQGDIINRLANAAYDFTMPTEMVNYFKFVDEEGSSLSGTTINSVLNLVYGTLKGQDEYDFQSESLGFIDPFSLQGSHTFWQVLLENSNPAMNEMFSEIRWNENGRPQLALYNRIKPFAFQDFTGSAGPYNKSYQAGAPKSLKSYMQLVRTHDIDAVTVKSVNAGTNWRDKYNFVEIKPQFQEFQIFANWYKQKSQQFDQVAFSREGFRPLIVETKQFPGDIGNGQKREGKPNWETLASWAKTLKEWYFDTHRMLNGTISMTGTTEYIGVGDNIKFDAGLINPTTNLKSAQKRAAKNGYILAHVENVEHSFSVSSDGAREYSTTIQFVRGILIDDNGIPQGWGVLDKNASQLTVPEQKNTKNTLGTSDSQDPDPQKVRGN